MRDKKIAGGKMTFIRKQDFPFTGDRATNFVPIYQQVGDPPWCCCYYYLPSPLLIPHFLPYIPPPPPP